MVVYVLNNAPDNLRGELTKWIMEVKPWVFVGSISKIVRDKLWERIQQCFGISGLMIYSFNNEQGFNIEMCGFGDRQVVDYECLLLVKRNIKT